ncbi:MAG: hypothetical protein FJX72_06990 [Armatimonadetes bacterium]|nr:hypothetical protein [Armatimonadota bacterium]
MYECFQYPFQTQHVMYGVVFDAHTGEPLYPIAPMGGGRHSVRQIRFPKRASVRMKPLDRPLTTQLSPPVVRGGNLWLRAEHLRAVEGVRVDVARDRVTVHIGGKTLNQADLGAQWRDFGWWVPLRHVAKLLGWQVDWNNAKKEAIVHTGG